MCALLIVILPYFYCRVPIFLDLQGNFVESYTKKLQNQVVNNQLERQLQTHKYVAYHYQILCEKLRLKMSLIGEGTLQPNLFSTKWKIERFFADCKNVGDFHKSAKFSILYDNQTTNWHIEIYPKGYVNNEDDITDYEDSASLYLCYESKDVRLVTVDYKFSIASEKRNLWKQNTNTFEGPCDDWGFSNFIKQDVLKDPNSGALVNDTLTILCEITFHEIDQNVKKRIDEYEKLLDNIGRGFENYNEALLESNYYSDVTFNIQNKKMYLHKAILMCRNSVFKAMFEHEIKESKESLVDITDVDFPVMKELFRFIYSGRVENIEKIAKNLLIAADKYAVEELKALCEKTLYNSLTADNAFEYLKLTEMCSTIKLKELVIEFVVENLKDIVQKSDFNVLFADLNREVVCEIVKALADKD